MEREIRRSQKPSNRRTKNVSLSLGQSAPIVHILRVIFLEKKMQSLS
jgi:hypothetical protein